jgi:hypothetical protein
MRSGVGGFWEPVEGFEAPTKNEYGSKKFFVPIISSGKPAPPWYPDSAESVASGDIVITRGGRSTRTG